MSTARWQSRPAGRVWVGGLWLLAGLVILAAMAMAARVMWPQAKANALAMEHLARVRAWQAPRAPVPSDELWLHTRLGLARALQEAPQHPDLHEAMAYLYLSAAWRYSHPLIQGPYLKQAVNHLEMAINSRPMVPTAWANLAMALHRLDQLDALDDRPAQVALMWSAFDRAMAYGQRDSATQQMLGALAFARWQELGPLRLMTMYGMLNQASAGQQRQLRQLAKAHGVELGQ